MLRNVNPIASGNVDPHYVASRGYWPPGGHPIVLAGPVDRDGDGGSVLGRPLDWRYGWPLDGGSFGSHPIVPSREYDI